MNVTEFTHIKLVKYLLNCYGLWPYQSTFIRHRNYMIFAMWTLLSLVPLVESLWETPNMDMLIYFGTLAGIGWILGTLLLSVMLYLKPRTFEKLYDQIVVDLSNISDSRELAILNEFQQQAQCLTFIYAGISMTGLSIFLILQYLPVLIGNAEEAAKMTSNYSKRWIIYENLHSIQVPIHIGLELLYGTLMYVAVMGAYFCGVKHTCGMNAIVSYKLRRLMDDDGGVITSLFKFRSDKKIIPEMLEIIKKHKSAIRSAHVVRLIFSQSFSVSQIGELVCLGILYFGFRYSFQTNDVFWICKIICLIGTNMEHAFYRNYGGELISGYSSKIYESTRHVNWYLMTPKARRLLLMIIIRSCRNEKLTSATITLSLESFLKIVKSSWSMAAVLMTITQTTV